MIQSKYWAYLIIISLKEHCHYFNMILEISKTYIDHWKLNNSGYISVVDKWLNPIREWGWVTMGTLETDYEIDFS